MKQDPVEYIVDECWPNICSMSEELMFAHTVQAMWSLLIKSGKVDMCLGAAFGFAVGGQIGSHWGAGLGIILLTLAIGFFRPQVKRAIEEIEAPRSITRGLRHLSQDQ